MTKAEIIRKLAKRAGITDLDAKVFFEAFLRKALLRLNPGDSVKVNGFGYFQRRTGRIKNNIDLDINKVCTDLIIFYPFRNENEEGNENLIFDVPVKAEEEYNLIDSYFSISFGKPVIPLKDANLSEFYIPPVGNELIRLIEIRAEKLLDETEVVENYIKGNELLLIDSGVINPNQMEINWEENNIARGSEGEIFSSGESNDPSDKTSWDFGEDLEKQIQEESILDTGSEDKLFVDYDDLKGLNWEFGINEKVAPVRKEEVENEKPADNESDKFQRVKSFASEFKIDQNKFGLTKSEMDLTWTFGPEDNDEDSELLKSITHEINDNGFAEVKYHKRKYKFETDISEPSDEEHNLPVEPEFISRFEQETKPDVDLLPDMIPGEKELEEIEEKLNEKLPEQDSITESDKTINKIIEGYPLISERTPGYTKKKGLGIFVISALVLVLCGSVLLYIKLTNMITPSKPGKKTETVSNNVSSVTIERDFDIPVTYPYLHDNSVKPPVDPLSGNLSTPVDLKETKSPEESKSVDKATPKSEIKKDANNLKPVKLKEFIYKSGDKYLVQVSSWPSEPAALKHASYFKNKGFETEIEKAYLGKGFWYRVRVGYFKSESEAETFYNKYK
jgi:hypothetical protein